MPGGSSPDWTNICLVQLDRGRLCRWLAGWLAGWRAVHKREREREREREL